MVVSWTTWSRNHGCCHFRKKTYCKVLVVLQTTKLRKAKQVYDVFNTKRKQMEAQTADADDLKMLGDLEKRIVEQG